MTAAPSTSALLSGAPVPEGHLGPRDPAVREGIFAFFMTRAALKPGNETPPIAPRRPGQGNQREHASKPGNEMPLIALADTPSDDGAGAHTDRQPGDHAEDDFQERPHEPSAATAACPATAASTADFTAAA